MQGDKTLYVGLGRNAEDKQGFARDGQGIFLPQHQNNEKLFMNRVEEMKHITIIILCDKFIFFNHVSWSHKGNAQNRSRARETAAVHCVLQQFYFVFI